ncbi:DoxX family protein [Pseudalkalibacillus hwajinpoensis]|uniref:DoxX family protein n=1 Tax=Guptibacillus hwajinpoensis TaxID=208199 RepID=A0A4U1MN14_9BACL|nr:DoxX family protein [Pseudalkalibacillus hwajinpoensis]TKD72174.1 DoxX family protein [Pseudalkalibacillus hwajinpoensis]
MNQKAVGYGLLIARVVLGIIMLAHGIQKWMGIEGVVGMFQDMIGLPGFLAYIIAAIELIGGLALIVGLKVRIASILIGIIMIGAIVIVKIPMVGFFGNGQMAGWEYDLSLLALAVLLSLSGSDLFSIDGMKTSETN